MYYDQFASVYSNYMVYGAAITVNFVPYTAYGSYYNIFVGIRLFQNAALTNTDPHALVEQGNFRYRIINTSANAVGCRATVKHYFNLKKFYNVRYPDPNWYGATVATNPVSDCDAFFHVVAGSISGVLFDQTVMATIKITYYVKFYNRIDQAQS